jgi:asparagine synthase (glutamine-hydrolysing)
MCGIAGAYCFNSSSLGFLSQVSKATETLNNRGPDHTGFYHDGFISLGHKRLSIIDVSTAANQPFTDVSGCYTIVFNGEIYNFKELKSKLILKGYKFISNSDTEVLLYQLIEYGVEKGLIECNGDFSFAFYNKTDKILTLARDRFGIKPLYYFFDDDVFCFSSEIKSLVKFPFEKSISKVALQAYFHLNYIPTPLSIFNNVYKIKPGHLLQVNSQGETMFKEYYKIKSDFDQEISYEDAKSQLRFLIEKSVESRMVSDVSIGTFLSGGIDSSIITGVASKFTNTLNTFSVGFPDEPIFDETKYASLIAKKFKTKHYIFSIRNNELINGVYELFENLDEPFADSSALAVYILSKETKKIASVALSGDGADELFAGYNKHAAEFKIRNSIIFNSLLPYLNEISFKFSKSRNSNMGNFFRKLDKYSRGIGLSAGERYWQWARWAGLTEIGLLKLEFNEVVEYEKVKNEYISNCNQDFDSVLRTDFKLVLENDMLVKVDRMSMANSLEVRVPFLDHEIVDFAFKLNTSYKIDNWNQKKILKDAFSDILPSEIVSRRKKGFEVPLLKWLRGDLRSLIDKYLSQDFIVKQNLFNYPIVENVKQKLFSDSPNDAVEQVWALLVFQFWWHKNNELFNEGSSE